MNPTGNDVIVLDFHRAGTGKKLTEAEKLAGVPPISWTEKMDPDGQSVHVTTLGKTYHIANTEPARQNLHRVLDRADWTQEDWVSFYQSESDRTRSERITILHKGRIYDPLDSWGADWASLGETDEQNSTLQAIIAQNGVYMSPESGGNQHELTGDDRKVVLAQVLRSIKGLPEGKIIDALAKTPLNTRGLRDLLKVAAAQADSARTRLIDEGIIVSAPGPKNSLVFSLSDVVVAGFALNEDDF